VGVVFGFIWKGVSEADQCSAVQATASSWQLCSSRNSREAHVQRVLIDGAKPARRDSALRVQRQEDASLAGEEDNQRCAAGIGVSARTMQDHSHWPEAIEHND